METIVYGLYQREADGTIRRAQGYEMSLPDDDDLHGEQLVGWPEAYVYWTAESGPAKGYAPVVLRPLQITTLGDLFAEEETRLAAKARAEMAAENEYWRTHPEELAERREAFSKKAAVFDDCEE